MYYQEIDPDKKAKKSWQAFFLGSPVLILSILAHIIFGILATLLIVQRIEEKRKQNFTELSVTSQSSAAAEAKQKASVKNALSSMTFPDVVRNITVANESAVSLPDVSVPQESSPSSGGKLDAVSLNGSGSGTGSDSSSSGQPMLNPTIGTDIDAAAIMASSFGMTDGQSRGLTGAFYDLKQTRNALPSPVAANFDNYYDVLYHFVSDGFAKTELEKYFKAPLTLYLPSVFVPYTSSLDAPVAFKVQNQVKPCFWCALYEGRFQVPEGGIFRMVGYADNLLEVQIDGNLVLNTAGWKGSPLLMDKLNHPPTGRYKYTIPVNFTNSTFSSAPRTFNFVCGDWMHFEAGSIHQVKVLIGDDDGVTGFWMMVERQGHDYAKTPAGSPILPLFRVSDLKLSGTSVGCPPCDEQHPLIWPLVTDDSASQ